MLWRALVCFVLGIVGCMAWASEYFQTTVWITLEASATPKAIESLSGKVSIDDQTPGRLACSIFDETSLLEIDKVIKNLDGLKSYRYSTPTLSYKELQKPGAKPWDEVRSAFKKRYQEYLEVLEPKERVRAEDKAPGLGYMDAWVYWMERRNALNNKVDIRALWRKAVEQADSLQIDDGTSSGWEEFGPGELQPPPGLTGFGPTPVTGRINCMAYNPNDPSIIWVGSAGGGLWKSTDSGQSWSPMSDQWKSMNISSIAVHPTNPSIVYVGTGDFNGWIFSSAGIYKTINNGSTWAQLSPTADWDSVNDIIIDPDNPNIVIAATGLNSQSPGKTYRSTSSGGAWTEVSTCYAMTITHNLFSGYVYLGTHYTNAVRRSTDQGATWTTSTFVGNGPFGGTDICASTTNSSRIFVVHAGYEKVYESNDWGSTWTEITGNLAQAGVWTQASTYNLHLTATETTGNVDVIYFGTRDLYRMIRPSTSWMEIGGMSGSAPRFHTDQHHMVFHPVNANQALISNDGGLYRITYNPSTGATSVGDLNNDMNTFQFYGTSFHPSDKWEMLGGAQDNGTFYQNGRLDPPHIVTGADGTWPVIKENETAVQLSGAQYLSQSDEDGTFHMRRTNDRWENKENTGSGQGVINEMPFVPIVIPDPTDPNAVYACGRGVYRYSFSSDSWTSRLGAFDFGARISAMAVAPTNMNRLYVGVGAKLYTSSNRGGTWSEVTASAPLPVGTGISNINVSPTSSTSVIVTSSSWYYVEGFHAVHECTNIFAPAWNVRTGNLPDAPVNDLERDPLDPVNTWYVASDVGLFKTVDRGGTWTGFGSAFPDVVVLDLQYVPGQKFLYATTFGRGIWRMGFTTMINPDTYTVYARSVSGNLSSLLTQDLNSLVIRPILEARSNPHNDRRGWVDFTYASPVSDPSKLVITFVAQQATATFKTSVQVYNVDFQRWEDLWVRNGAFLFSSQTATLDGGNSLSEYLSIFGTFRIRFKIEPLNSKARDTSLNIDRLDLEVYP